jgi:hypothetical protein
MRTPATAITILSDADWAETPERAAIVNAAPDAIDDATNCRREIDLLIRRTSFLGWVILV